MTMRLDIQATYCQRSSLSVRCLAWAPAEKKTLQGQTLNSRYKPMSQQGVGSAKRLNDDGLGVF